MKRLLKPIFCLFILFVGTNILNTQVWGQTINTTELKQCRELVDDAQYFLHEAATKIQLCDGATTVEDVKYYCFESLSSIDSVDFKLQEALFKTNDIEYLLKNSKDSLLLPQVGKMTIQLQEAQKNNSQTQKTLGHLLDETRPAVINQKLFDVGETINNSSSQINQAQRLLKGLTKPMKH